MIKEKWKKIDGYNGRYLISNFGKVKSFALHKPKILNGGHTRGGYLNCTVSKNGEKRVFLIHRLVAFYFIPNPKNKPCVNHKDGDVKNNKINNLEWCTCSENEKHSYIALGKKPICSNKGKFGSQSHYSVKVVQYDKKGNLIKNWDCQRLAAKTLGISESNISSVCSGKRKTAGGYVWRKFYE